MIDNKRYGQMIVGCYIFIGSMINPNIDRVSDYTIYYKDKLGSGGLADVFKCERQGEQFAVKVIKNLNRFRPEQRDYLMKALRRERLNLQALNGSSQNIMKFCGFAEENDAYYLFTELCQMSLEEKICRRGPIKEEEAVQYLFQIVNGYWQLYKLSIIHRDIKPANILITAQDVIKLADFGISKQIQLKNTVIGTVCYESPQLLQGKQYSYKCDIWGIAMTFYEMLHGKLPYNQQNLKNPSQILEQIKKMDIDGLIGGQFSPPARQFIKQGLAFEECDRIQFKKILEHPIFASKFYAKNYMSDLRLAVRLNRIDIQSICKSYNFHLKQQVNLAELGVFLKQINKSIDGSKIKAIFNTYKPDQKETIEIGSILQLLVDSQSRIIKKNENSVNLGPSHQKTVLSSHKKQNKIL